MARYFTYETTFSKDEQRLRCGDARPLRAAHPLTCPLAERGIAHGWWQEKTLSPDTTLLPQSAHGLRLVTYLSRALSTVSADMSFSHCLRHGSFSFIVGGIF